MDDESGFCFEEGSKGVLMKGVNLDVNDLIKLESCIEEWSYIEYFEGIDELRIINNLQVACKKADLQRVEKLIGRGLHNAAESGEIDVKINLILKYCPESAEKTRETCLHVAVKHNQIDVVLRRLLKWVIGERPRFLHVLDFKDHKASTSAKQYYINIPVTLGEEGSGFSKAQPRFLAPVGNMGDWPPFRLPFVLSQRLREVERETGAGYSSSSLESLLLPMYYFSCSFWDMLDGRN